MSTAFVFAGPQATAIAETPSQRNGTQYWGVTDYLALRVWQHRSGLMCGFTQRYKVHPLVYFEFLEDMI